VVLQTPMGISMSSAVEVTPATDIDVRPARAGSIARRSLRLLVGLWVFALGLALMVRARLGLSSWDVLHDAMRGLTPLTLGQAVIVVSIVVVAGSYVLGVKPGPGTLANMILVGAFADVMLASGVLDGLASSPLPVRSATLVAGILAIALGTALYIGAELGAGPRDSLMLAIAKAVRTSPGRARAVLEGLVLVLGAVLGGRVGVGTIAFVVLIGPAIDGAFRLFRMDTRRKEP
jgi:uncharacterized membrane protein YczE